MSYTDIFMLGWNLNGLMFVINFVIALQVVKTVDISNLRKESETLKTLKQEFDKLLPHRKYDILITYAIPFTAFFRISFRIFEMIMFFNKNNGTKMYDFMVYKYQSDINRVKNK